MFSKIWGEKISSCLFEPGPLEALLVWLQWEFTALPCLRGVLPARVELGALLYLFSESLLVGT